MQDGRNLARKTAVIHHCVQSGKRPQARIPKTFFRKKTRSQRFKSRCWSATRFLEKCGRSRISESCCSKDETMFRKTIFRYLWITSIFRDEQIQAVMYFVQRQSMITGRWRQVTVWSLDWCNTIRVAHQKPTRKQMWVQRRLTKKQVTTRPGNFWPEEGPTWQKASSVKPLISGQEKTQIGRCERTTKHFLHYGRGARLWENHDQRQKNIGDKECLNDALQNHPTSQPERFQMEATLCKRLVYNWNDMIEFIMFKASSWEHHHSIERNSNYKE